MKKVIPFNKDIEFDNNIYEISSISLEHDENINESIVGNLVISGEYRSHELSVNKESFKYEIPFNIEIDDSVIRDSITIDIDDFKYEFKNNILTVDIVLSIYANEIEIKDNIEDLIDKIEEREEIINEEININEVEEEKEEKEEKEEIEEQKEVILNNVSTKDEYITYKVHTVSVSENVESICALYKISPSLISDYNDISNINVGDKLIIPIDINE